MPWKANKKLVSQGLGDLEYLPRERCGWDNTLACLAFGMRMDIERRRPDLNPWVAAVSGTDFCHIGLDVDEKRNRLVVFSVLDSLGKGGTYAGVQNLNLLFGLDETTGLKRHALHPH